MANYDVGIVGAGVHGASAAFHLSNHDLRVVVYEQATPAQGPTGLSSAVCRAYYTNSFLAQVARESLQMLTDFGVLTDGRDAGFQRTGALFLHPEEDESDLQATAESLRAVGTRIDVVGPEDVRGMLPDIDLAGVALAAWEPDAGYADPAGTTEGLLAEAIRRRTQLRRHVRVQAIAPGPQVRVSHSHGEDTVGRLLVAAGPWTAGLVASAGVKLPLVAERHVVARCGYSPGETQPFVIADLPGGYYFKPEGFQQFLLGSLLPLTRVDPDAAVERLREEEAVRLMSPLASRFPQMDQAEMRGGWSSLYDVSPDWQPVIGEVAENLFVDAGTSGHGFKLAPAMGRYVAGLVTGVDTHPGLAQFHPERFVAGESLSSGYGDARILG